jgi:DNA polymerase (family 10)
MNYPDFTHNVDNKKIDFTFENGVSVEVFYCEPGQFVQMLHLLTGSSQYLDKLNETFKETEYFFEGGQLFKGKLKLICKNENDIYKFLKISFIPPELREDNNEIDLAKKNKIPKLIELKDIKSALHIHSSYSDGLYSLEEMVKEAQRLGFEYIGICDHSKTAAYANGLKEEDLKKQFKEIDLLNNKYDKIKILKGIESDILTNGNLDYSDDILKNFDFIVASIHSGFSLNKEDMTQRILRAVENKYATILGHPTGRLLLSREPYQIDIDKILNACINNNIAVELNSDEHRLDLSWEVIRNYLPKGLKISINSDAHHIDALQNVKYGVMMARKAFASKKDVINALSYSDFLKYLSNKKRN